MPSRRQQVHLAGAVRWYLPGLFLAEQGQFRVISRQQRVTFMHCSQVKSLLHNAAAAELLKSCQLAPAA